MQEVKYTLVGSSAKCVTGTIVQAENGALRLNFGEVDGRLVYRVNAGLSHTVKVREGIAVLTTRTLSPGTLFGELYVDDAKYICEPLAIQSFFEANKNRLTACPSADEYLSRLVEVERKIEELKSEYAKQYKDLAEKLDEANALLRKISKSYGLGIFGGIEQ